VELVILGIEGNRLKTEELNHLFSSLDQHTIEHESKMVFIAGNPGAFSCDQSIAIGKNWRVNSNFQNFFER
jgi:hypothetical protein